MATDYISREAAIEDVCKRLRFTHPGSGEEYSAKDVRAFVEAMLLPVPAADVVEVVRCKNCLHYEMGVCLKIYDDGNVSKDAWQERKPTDFCSYGEDRNVPTNCGADMRKEQT